jgi:hypothetical protein
MVVPLNTVSSTYANILKYHVAPLRIETGRYENKNVNERVCFICHDQREDDKHFLLDCPLCADLRESLFNEVKRSSLYLYLSQTCLYMFNDNKVIIIIIKVSPLVIHIIHNHHNIYIV